MNRHLSRRTAVVIGAAALLVAGVVIVALQDGMSSTDAGARVQSSPPPSVLPSALPSALPSGPPSAAMPSDDPGGNGAGTPVTPDAAVETPVTGNVDAGMRTSTEVLPPAAPSATSLPQSKPPPVLVTLPLPDSQSANGSIVDGFPSAVIDTAPGSTISGSSVSSEGARMHATLTARSTLTGVDVLGYYRTTLAQLGLYDAPAPAAAGSSAVSFTRDGNSVTVTVTERTGGSQYEIFASFTAAS